MIDLHTHSTASDGSLSPAELVARALEAEVTYLGLTDHDTTAGLEEARQASQNTGLTLINGIELSAATATRTVHIVGLGIDPGNSELCSLIECAQRARIDRAKGIGEKLENAGITNAFANTVTLAGTDVLGRAHFAQMLVEQGHAKNFKKVFKRYMVRGKPGYVAANWCSVEKAIEVIHSAGGAAILAHPMRYGLSRNQLEQLVAHFAAADGDAIEIVSGQTTEKEINVVSALAEKHNLAASTGSDYHGPDKPWMTLGRTPALPADCETVWQRHSLWG